MESWVFKGMKIVAVMSRNKCMNPLITSCCGTSKFRLTTRLNMTSLTLRYWIRWNGKCLIIDVPCPFGIRVKDKWKEKIENYQDLRRELKRIWKLRRVTVVPIIIGALETISKDIEKWLAEIGVTCRLESLRRACLLGTARILRKVLDT